MTSRAHRPRSGAAAASREGGGSGFLPAIFPPAWRRLLLLFVLVTFAIALGAFLIFEYEQRAIADDAFARLSGIHRRTLDDIEAWQHAREETLERLATRDEYRSLLARPAGQGEIDGPAWRAFRNDLDEIVARPRFNGAVVFHRDGTVRLRAGEPMAAGFTALAREAMAAGRTVYGDNIAQVDGAVSAVRVLQVVPVRWQGRIVGAIGLQLDPNYHLESLVAVWPEAESSGEVLLVRIIDERIYYLTPPRLAPTGRVFVVDSARVLLSRLEGQRLRGLDYRGRRVFGVVTPVPETPWRLVTKIDEAEVFARVRELALWITLVSISFVLAAGALILFWWRKERADNLVARYTEELRRRALESHYEYLAKYAYDPILLAGEDLRILEFNERAVEFYGYSPDELRRMRTTDLRAQPEPKLAAAGALESYQHAAIYESEHRTKDGRVVPVEISARTIRVDDRLFHQATVRDITERRRAEQRIRRLNDLYNALSQINMAVARHRERQGLLSEVCRIAVEYGHFDFAWVGLLSGQPPVLVRVAEHGDEGYARLLDQLEAGPGIVGGPGPVAAALSTGEIGVHNDIGKLPRPYQAIFEESGMRAGAGLPLRVEGHLRGAIGIYSSQPGVFDAEVTQLLTEVAEDISFALESYEREARRLEAERATRESEARYRNLFDNMSSGVIVYQPMGDGADFIVKDINRAVQRIENITRERIVGHPLLDVIPAAEAAGLLSPLREARQTGRAVHVGPLQIEHYGGRGWRELWVYALPNGEVVEVYDDVTDRMEAIEALRRSQQRLSLVLKGVNDAYWDLNYETGEVYYSRRFAEMFGYDPGELNLGIEGWSTLVHPQDLTQVSADLEHHLKGRSPQFQSEQRMRCKSGDYIWVRARGSVVRRGQGGKALRMAGTLTDITDEKRDEEQLQLWATVFAGSREAIFITDAKRCIISANAAFTEITGYTEEEVKGRDPSVLSSGEHDRAFYQNLWAELNATGHWQGELRDRRKNGEVFPMWTAITAVYDAEHRVRNYIAISSDISERKAAEEHIRFLAQHDALTGLPNRALLQDRLEQAIAHAQRTQGRAAVLFVDLDRFKNINDSLGHHIGDELLKLVSVRLKGCVRLDDTVSRQGGDEFLLVLTELRDVADAAHVAQKVIDVVTEPFAVNGNEIHITLSIGIAISPEDGTDGETLIRNADAAMYYAKERGRNNYQFFIPELNRRALRRISLENSLRRAVDQGDFVLHYQPQLDTWSNRLVGVEALIRWQHEGRLVAPADFIPVAEDTGLILPIGAWVLTEACRQRREWTLRGLPDVPVAVNISASQFRQRNVLEKLSAVVSSCCINPGCLELELTESVIMEDAKSSVAILRGLKEMGIGLAIDDFGTGYSSLSYLRRFPIDRLKVDQSFVHDLDIDAADRAITEAIINLAKSLGLKVIAEGVERLKEIELLRDRKCDELQGFYFSPPLPAADLEIWWRGLKTSRT